MPSKENDVGRVLRDARVAKGMTQAMLGERLGYSAMAISHFENGARPIRAEELKRASELLGVDLGEHATGKTAATFFRATNVRGGRDAITRSLSAFDRYVDKKYGDNSST